MIMLVTSTEDVVSKFPYGRFASNLRGRKQISRNNIVPRTNSFYQENVSLSDTGSQGGRLMYKSRKRNILQSNYSMNFSCSFSFIF